MRRVALAFIGFLALVLGLSVLPLSLPATAALPSGPLFRTLTGFVPAADDVRVAPREYTAVSADQASLRQALMASEISLPDPSGVLRRFSIAESPIMEPGLAARHPEIRTYAGRGLDDPTSTIRLDLTPMGLHASVRRPGGAGTWYIDPAYNARGTSTYLSYLGASLPEPAEEFVERELDRPDATLAPAATAGRIAPGEEVKLRTYRLALVTDPTYAAYFGTENVLAEKVTLINRVNQIYNDDVAIRLVLIDGSDKLNLDTAAKATGANGPCGVDACYDQADIESCSGSTLTRNEWVLGQLVGADAYDVGHIGLGTNGGGIAGLGVVGEQYKADGCTGIPTPEGDFYAVDYVAHEMGHQFNGNHTFNGTQVNCSLTNRNGDTSVEPGSGSSVMAYAGICGQDDLQPHSDPYLSQRSIDEFTVHVEADPFTYDEVQTISLVGFDTDGETFTLTYPGHDPVTMTRGAASYSYLKVQQAIYQLTGLQPTVAGYDGGIQVNDGGFQLTFRTGSSAAGTDVPTIGVIPGPGVDRAFTGVQIQGGPGTNQGVATASGNHAPSVTAPADKDLPVQTPFALTASGSDIDGDALTYLWEQNDVGSTAPTGGTALVSNTKADGPLFRVFGVAAPVTHDGALQSPSPGENLADGTPTRVFPDLAQVLAGNTNAKSGSCPAAPADTAVDVPPAVVECYSEFLPTADYGNPLLGGALNFRVTARDLAPEAGGTAYDDVTLTLDSSAGPLLVTSQAASATVVGGLPGTVTWDVAGTDAAALAPTVRVMLSTDGGQTWTAMTAAVPNDGSQEVIWPQVATDQARIKVEAVDNYFFAVNDAPFTIRPSVVLSGGEARATQYSDPFATAVTLTATSQDFDADQLTAAVTGVSGLVATRTSATADGVRPSVATFEVNGPVLADVGAYSAVVAVGAPSVLPASTSFDVTVTPEDVVRPFSTTTEFATFNPWLVQYDLQLAEPAEGHPGDLATASLTIAKASGQTLCTATITHVEGDPTTASCGFSLPAPVGTTSYPIEFHFGGNYSLSDADDDAVIVVERDGLTTDGPFPTITGGPRDDSFVTASSVTFHYTSDVPSSTFKCTLDGKPKACAPGGVTLSKLAIGTHVFTVSAYRPDGTGGAYSDAVRWARPVDDLSLTKTGSWTTRLSKAAYFGSMRETRAKGASLSRWVKRAVKLSVLVQKGPGYGSVVVLVGGKPVKTISLASSVRRRVMVPVWGGAGGPFTGKVTLRTTTGKLVQIDALGVLRAEAG